MKPVNNIKIYISTPTSNILLPILARRYTLSSSIEDANVVISEGLEIAHDCLHIVLSDKDIPNAILIDSTLHINDIVNCIDSAIQTYVFLSDNSLNTITANISKAKVKKLEDIINSSNESVLDVAKDGEVIFFNKAFKELFSPDEVLTDINLFDILDSNTARFFKNYFIESKPKDRKEFMGIILRKDSSVIYIEGKISTFATDKTHFGLFFDSVESKLASELRLKKIEEQSLVAGFSRHLSHNVTNALTAAGGFIRQVKAKTSDNLLVQNLWKIIDNKLQLIEEIVAGYNDYTHSLSFKLNEDIDIVKFFEEQLTVITNKKLDRNFTAFLYRYEDSFNLSYNKKDEGVFIIKANKLFLKLALCYILKDNIRFFIDHAPIHFNIELKNLDDKFAVVINILDIEIEDHILSTMLEPWNHNLLSQSFDYWGVVIASVVVERHNGEIKIEKANQTLALTLLFNK